MSQKSSKAARPERRISASRSGLAFLPACAAALLALMPCGCTSTRSTIELDALNPSIRQSANGVLIGDTYVRPEKVAEVLDDFDIPRDRTIHILLDDDVRDLRPARFLMACLAKAGYTRPVLVTKRHAEAVSTGKKRPVGKPPAQTAPQAPRKIRYKPLSR